MLLTPNTITLRTVDGSKIATLALMGAFKGDPGAGADIYNQTVNLYNQIASGLIPLTEIIASRVITGEHATHLLRCNSEFDIDLTIRANDGALLYDFNTNPAFATFFSVLRRGTGDVFVLPAPGVTITCPEGYLPHPRVVGSVITFTADSQNNWICSGDMAFVE